MTQTCIIVPFSGEGRARACSWVLARVAALHPQWRRVIATDPTDGWTKARAVNAAVPRRAEILVVCDADVAVTADALRWAVDWVRAGRAWAVPYGTVYRLTAMHTETVLTGDPTQEIGHLSRRECILNRPPYRGIPGGGIFVVAREAWELVGGFDERFVWGHEDVPLACALDTLAGPHEQHDGPLWHLWHPARRPTPAMYDDQRLEARYVAAEGDVAAMKALIASGPHASVTRALS